MVSFPSKDSMHIGNLMGSAFGGGTDFDEDMS